MNLTTIITTTLTSMNENYSHAEMPKGVTEEMIMKEGTYSVLTKMLICEYWHQD